MKNKKENYERIHLYGGDVRMHFYPKAHMYRMFDPANGVANLRTMGVTTVTGVMDKPGLMDWAMNMALRYAFGRSKRKDPIDGKMKWTVIPEIAQLTPGKSYSIEELKMIADDAATAFRRKQTRGTDVGSIAHDWMEKWLIAKRDDKELPPIPKFEVTEKKDVDIIEQQEQECINIHKSLEQFIEWFEENGIKVHLVEKYIYSREYVYSGQMDSVLEIPGEGCFVTDLKTTNPSRAYPEGIYPENFAQTGGYDIALTEELPEYNDKLTGHMIINASKAAPKFSVFKTDKREEGREWFMRCYELRNYKKEFDKMISNTYKENQKARKEGTHGKA